MIRAGILRFNLRDGESIRAFQRAVAADGMAQCLWRLRDALRRRLHDAEGEHDQRIFEDLLQALGDDLGEEGVDLDYLWQ